MRIHEGNFAYDVEQPRDPLTQLRSKWKYAVYQLRPVEHIIMTGQAETMAEAEKKAKRSIAKLKAEEVPVAA